MRDAAAKARISLWNISDLCLIVDFPSGVEYTNQTGGNMCRQMVMEGVLMPFGNDIREDGRVVGAAMDLYDYFSKEPYWGVGAIGGITEEDAAFIDSVLRKHYIPSVITVDRSRLSESDEAWVHVVLRTEEDRDYKLFEGLGPYPRQGVLTWTNSD